jgi:hypothetical protein
MHLHFVLILGTFYTSEHILDTCWTNSACILYIFWTTLGHMLDKFSDNFWITVYLGISDISGHVWYIWACLVYMGMSGISGHVWYIWACMVYLGMYGIPDMLIYTRHA